MNEGGFPENHNHVCSYQSKFYIVIIQSLNCVKISLYGYKDTVFNLRNFEDYLKSVVSG
jgi:hypothetical protein